MEPINIPNVQLLKLDLSDKDAIVNVINSVEPDQIYHLAGQSSVKLSWDNIYTTFEANVNRTISLLEGVRKSKFVEKVKVLTVGSSEEYGKIMDNSQQIHENISVMPQSPYGISKATVSHLSRLFSQTYGMNVIHVRPFNHIGPYQNRGFVAPDFAHQIVEIERGLKRAEIVVGNLNAKRDFTDVRDIVRAYQMLLEKGEIGETYNVCSGRAVSIRDLLDLFLSKSTHDIQVITDMKLFRPTDLPIFVGSYNKLKQQTGWNPMYELSDTVQHILDDIRSH